MITNVMFKTEQGHISMYELYVFATLALNLNLAYVWLAELLLLLA